MIGLGRHLRGNAVAYLALFLALGMGTAWALDRNSVRSKHIAPNAIRGADVKEASLRGLLRGDGRALGKRTHLENATTTARRVVDLPGFGPITGDCPEGQTPDFIFKNQSGRSVELVEAHQSGDAPVEEIAPGDTEELSGGFESPDLGIWRFAIGDTIATVWPIAQKPGVGSSCHIWMQALITR